MRRDDVHLESLDEFAADRVGEVSAPAVDPLERRAHPRFTPLGHRAWLGAWLEDVLIASAARLVEISRGGAVVECGEPRRRGESVCLCVESHRDAEGCIAACVAGVAGGSRGRYRLRLEFEGPCPDRILMETVSGTPLGAMDPDASGAEASFDAVRDDPGASCW